MPDQNSNRFPPFASSVSVPMQGWQSVPSSHHGTMQQMLHLGDTLPVKSRQVKQFLR